ncbi:MAG TPA: nickel pincer cofactor biosynthesis protein LarB [Hyphomicrobiales bacterium]|nr:nickel pincer cofactor biosynthesis protein LarB [Hyphomicrobiales bacterium]
MTSEMNFDWGRRDRIGIGEAVLCEGKSLVQLQAITNDVRERGVSCLMTRLDPDVASALGDLDYDEASRTAYLGKVAPPSGLERICIITAGSTDVPVAKEAARTLQFYGEASKLVFDIGVAGLHRLAARIPVIAAYPVVIIVAGMDAALASVVAGQVPGMVIGVPVSTGYGVAQGGQTALNAMLSSCAAGLTVVNIDNGFGAACAALRILGAAERLAKGE